MSATQFLLKEETHRIIGCSMEVINEIGHGFHEKIYENALVDTKTIERIGDIEIGQMLNYLKVTGLNIGLLINFKNANLDWKRVVR